MRRLDMRLMLPILSLAILLALVFWIQPRAMSYRGVNLLFNLSVPIALATIAQMIIIMVDDIDLSMGTYVSFVACVTATFVNDAPLVGYAILAASVLVYAGLGALIQARGLPAIVVTLGMSFVWGGMAVLVLPSPGGASPVWLREMMISKPPLVPMAIVACFLIALVSHLVIMRSSFGVLLRGLGGNPRTLSKNGWSLIGMRASAYGLAAIVAVLAGMTLVGLSTAADANIALRYTLLSIAGVILGGGEFTGGRISPIGAVIGAMTLTLAGSFLSFLRLSPDWQIGAQGAILIAVLAARLMFSRKTRTSGGTQA